MSEGPKVYPGPTPNRTNQWYVAEGINGSARYLHADGVWRASTRHEGQFTGYFPAREAAQKALEAVTAS